MLRKTKMYSAGLHYKPSLLIVHSLSYKTQFSISAIATIAQIDLVSPFFIKGADNFD